MQDTVYDIVECTEAKIILGVSGKSGRNSVLIMPADKESMESFIQMGHRGYLTGMAYEMYAEMREP